MCMSARMSIYMYTLGRGWQLPFDSLLLCRNWIESVYWMRKNAAKLWFRKGQIAWIRPGRQSWVGWSVVISHVSTYQTVVAGPFTESAYSTLHKAFCMAARHCIGLGLLLLIYETNECVVWRGVFRWTCLQPKAQLRFIRSIPVLSSVNRSMRNAEKTLDNKVYI